MKKLIIAVLLVVSVTTFAQEKKHPKGERENLTSQQKVDLQVKKLTKDLDLNESQAKSVRTLVERQVEKREAKKEEFSTLKKEERKKMKSENKPKMEEEQAYLTEEMKKILTADQFSKWEKMKEERQNKMKEKMSERKDRKGEKN